MICSFFYFPSPKKGLYNFTVGARSEKSWLWLSVNLAYGDWICTDKGKDWENYLLTDRFICFFLTLFPRGVGCKRIWDHWNCSVTLFGRFTCRKEVTVERANSLQVILLMPQFHLMRKIGVFWKCKFLWDGSGGGLCQWEQVGPSPKEETVEQVLISGLLWLGGNTC